MAGFHEDSVGGVDTVVFYSRTSIALPGPGDWVFRVDIPRDLAPGDYDLPLDPLFNHFVVFSEGFPIISGGYGVAGTLTLIDNDIGEGKVKGFVSSLRAEPRITDANVPPTFAHRIEFRAGS